VLVWAGGIRGPSDAREADKLRRLAESLGVADRWRPTGYLSAPEFASVLARADIGVAPFRHVPPLRAMRDAGAGVVLTQAGDASQLRSAVKWLLEDAPAADTLRSANRSFTAKNTFGSLGTEILSAMSRIVSRQSVCWPPDTPTPTGR
jgi:hypothetical protein